MELKWNKDGLLPVVVQDADSREVLMIAYMNEESLRMTMKTGLAHYWSRSRKKIWKKGESSGNVQNVVEIRVDCDKDSLLLIVKQKGGACHTGYYSCFYRNIEGEIVGKKVFDPDEVYGERK